MTVIDGEKRIYFLNVDDREINDRPKPGNTQQPCMASRGAQRVLSPSNLQAQRADEANPSTPNKDRAKTGGEENSPSRGGGGGGFFGLEAVTGGLSHLKLVSPNKSGRSRRGSASGKENDDRAPSAPGTPRGSIFGGDASTSPRSTVGQPRPKTMPTSNLEPTRAQAEHSNFEPGSPLRRDAMANLRDCDQEAINSAVTMSNNTITPEQMELLKRPSTQRMATACQLCK